MIIHIFKIKRQEPRNVIGTEDEGQENRYQPIREYMSHFKKIKARKDCYRNAQHRKNQQIKNI
jgi:hypothetical protein